MSAQIFKYNECEISFNLNGNGVMVNATQMAKPFGKNAGHWMRNQSTQEFINELSALRNCKGSDLVRIENGIGCWMHEDVALEFARWLSPKIAIWCNDRIKELLRHGFTATDNKLEEMLNNPDLVIGLASKLKEERARAAMLERKVETVVKENNKLRPKAEFMDKVMDADERIDIGQSAKILNLPFGRNTLFQKLRDMGVFFKNKNEPKQGYVKRGYFVLKEKWIDRNNHDGFMVLKVLVTQKGLEFLANLFKVVEQPKEVAEVI